MAEAPVEIRAFVLDAVMRPFIIVSVGCNSRQFSFLLTMVGVQNDTRNTAYFRNTSVSATR